jgi:hypothetical protein
VEELRRQNEQIANIHDDLKTMEDGLTRADKLIRAFGRRLATDKFIQLFFVLNFGALVAIIVWYAVKRGKIKPPNINVPPMPQPAISSMAQEGATIAEQTAHRYLRWAG